mgnify:CR=1 FL=1
MTDSGGAGNGAAASAIAARLLATEVPITGSQCSDRHEVKPWPIFGGEPGGNGGTLIKKNGIERMEDREGALRKGVLEQVRQHHVRAGRPHQADGTGRRRIRRSGRARPGAVAEDVAEGYVSRAAAKEFYGAS